MIYQKKHLFLIFLIFWRATSSAQDGYSISGQITDENKHPLTNVVVFISGSQKNTVSDQAGNFTLANLKPGYFTVSIKMLGYVPFAQNIQIDDKAVNLFVVLKIKPVVLKEVVIGKRKINELFLNAFKEQFLGSTINGKSCILQNPGVLNFSTNKTILTADADDFLIVINKRLGYKIKYMLKDFWYNAQTNRTNYSGDAVFEELPGTENLKKRWEKNRANAYKESLVHFLRSVYSNTVLKEGFLAYKRYPKPANNLRNDLIFIDPRPVQFDSLITKIDTSFVAFRAIPLYVIYNPKLAANINNHDDNFSTYGIDRAEKSTLINFSLDRAVIDRKGVFKDYKGMSFDGLWGMSRLGDKLPLEYDTPAN
jgi:hypothetical protein